LTLHVNSFLSIFEFIQKYIGKAYFYIISIVKSHKKGLEYPSLLNINGGLFFVSYKNGEGRGHCGCDRMVVGFFVEF
jgi:hypothetical protein